MKKVNDANIERLRSSFQEGHSYLEKVPECGVFISAACMSSLFLSVVCVRDKQNTKTNRQQRFPNRSVCVCAFCICF